MSYQPTTDFLALLRQTAGGVRTERMPGLDYVVSALGRAGLISLFVGQSAPVVNQASTVWFQPAASSWVSEGAISLWDVTVPPSGAYRPATPALWSTLIAGPIVALIPLPSAVAPLVDGVAAVGVSLAYTREDHRHPTDTSRAPLASPTFTGSPQAPTAVLGDSSTLLATTAFVIANGGLPPPIGSVIPYAGNVAPNANWQLCQGQAVSRVTFAALLGVTGIVFGAGDGVTTFNLPDLRGRVPAGVDGGANRLTAATMTSQNIGGTNITAETKALATANLPAYTPTGTVVTTTAGLYPQSGAGGGNIPSTGANDGFTTPINTSTFTGAAQGGTATAFGLTQPTIELQMLIRVS